MTMNDQKLSVLLQWLEEQKRAPSYIADRDSEAFKSAWYHSHTYAKVIDKVNELLQTPSVD